MISTTGNKDNERQEEEGKGRKKRSKEGRKEEGREASQSASPPVRREDSPSPACALHDHACTHAIPFAITPWQGRVLNLLQAGHCSRVQLINGNAMRFSARVSACLPACWPLSKLTRLSSRAPLLLKTLSFICSG